MPLPLFSLPPADQRRWIKERLARPAPESALGMNDGFRLPGRDGAIPDVDFIQGDYADDRARAHA